MLSHPLLLSLCAGIAISLATGASAFADLDCIGTETCNDEGCTPYVDVFAVDFDWATDSLTLPIEGTPRRLALSTPDVDADGTSGQLVYRATDGIGLWLTFRGEAITMELFLDDANRTHHAICAAREAA